MTAVLATTQRPSSVQPGSLVYINGGKLKTLGDGKVGGYLVMFGGPKDSQGEYFRDDVECHLEWYGGEKRPILYHHGLEDEDIIEEIGYTDIIRRDAKGLWAEGRLNMSDPRATQIYNDVRSGKIGWSSGSAPHLSKIDDAGGIWEWAIVEGSLTPTPAAGKRTTVQALKFDYSSTLTPSETTVKEPVTVKERVLVTTKGGGVKEKQQPYSERNPIMKIKGSAGMIGAMQSAGIDADSIIKVLMSLEEAAEGEMMTDTDMVDEATMADDVDLEEQLPAKDAGPVTEGDAATIDDSGPTPAMNPPQQLPAPAAGSSKTAKSMSITDTDAIARKVAQLIQQGARTAPAASKAGGSFVGRNPARINDRVADIKSQYHDLDAADMAYAAMLYNSRKGGGRQAIPVTPEFMHVLATKAMNQYEDNKLILDKGLVAITRKIALKADFNNTLVAGEGASWVPDLWSSQLWMRVRIDNNVARNVEVFAMPSPTFEYPIESSDPTVYSVGQSDTDAEQTLATNVFTRSKLTVSKLQFVAAKTGLQVGFSTEIEEDSIIPFIPQLRAQATRAFANSIDNNLVNSDSTTGTGNINYKGANTSAAPTANFLFGGGNGMRYNALITNTAVSQSLSGGQATLTQIRSLRFKMISATNTYGINPEDLVIITDPFTYGKFLSIDEINTYMNNGRNATVNTGVVPNIDGTPVYASAEMNLSDSTGYVTSTNWNVLAAPSSTNLGNFLIFAKNAWKVGYVRQVMTDVSYVPWNDSYILTMTARYAIGKKDTVASALAYNISVT